MKTFKKSFPIFILVALITISSFAQDVRPSREKWNLISTQGTVNSINKETREVELMGSKGDLVTITASDAVKRFDEISVGDIVTFDYYVYLKAEFRQPTAEELAEPLVILAEAGKAPEGMDPAAVVGAVVRAVVTIEALNRPYMIATVKGPRGNYTSIPMEDKELITQLHIGEIVILTYSEAMAISLEKVKPKY